MVDFKRDTDRESESAIFSWRRAANQVRVNLAGAVSAGTLAIFEVDQRQIGLLPRQFSLQYERPGFAFRIQKLDFGDVEAQIG